MSDLTGRVLYPGDPGWDEARQDFNARFDVQPRAIVFAQESADVVNAVRWARENDAPMRARSGRHSYEGYSLVADGVVIDVSELDTVRVDRQAGTATIGAGIDMLNLSEALGEVGVIFPLATGPTVGLGGFTLGGGFGLTSRKLGLACDNLIGLELVDAGGNLTQVSKDQHADLFWACCGGGGGNFGIVTSFTFTVHPVGVVAAFTLQWPWNQFEQVVGQWQQWTTQLDEDFTTALQLGVDGAVRLYGLYCPDDAGRLPLVRKALEPLLQATTPTNVSLATLPYTIAARMFFAEGAQHVDPQQPRWAVHVHSDQQIYKSTSAAALKAFDAGAIAKLKKHLEAAPQLSVPPSQPCMVQLLGGGGAISRVKPEDTAVYWRGALFIVQYDGFWTAPQDGERVMDWLEAFRTDMLSHTEGAYVNYVDSRLENPLKAYYGENLDRLRQVKRKYDPENVYNFPQSIPI